MERGFKSRCEEMSRSLRTELGLRTIDPLAADKLASHLGVLVLPLSDLGLPPEDFCQLTEIDADSWSAITVSAFGRDSVIVNPTHRGGRYSSDLMHELAHLILGHRPSTVFFVGDGELALRGYSSSAEEEADWLSATLLLPRDALVHIKRRRISRQLACEQYGVSQQMLKFRTDKTGVTRQFNRRNV
jgi:hypothetical protein